VKRRGRKRKSGVRREPNGRALRAPVVVRENVMAVALAQPHRAGAENPKDVLLESPLGRFILQFKLDRNCFDAALAYARLTRRVFAARGIPQPHKDGHKAAEGGFGLSAETARHLRSMLEEIDKRL